VKVPFRAALYLWSLPYGLIGILAALVFWALRWVHVGGWRTGALELVCKGPFAAWMDRPRIVTDRDGKQYESRWAGFTLGWTIFFWAPPSPEVRAHERRHVEQATWLGVLYPILYLGLLPFTRYRGHPLERDARRAAGQPVER
jgi:hypothetical protein